MPVTPPCASLPVSRKRAATPGPSTENKRACLSQGNQLMNGLNKTMNRVTDVIENVFRPSDIPSTPVCLQDTIACAMELEKDWLTPKQLVKLVDVFERMPHAAVSYQSMKDNEELRKSWVCMKIGIVIPEDESA